MAEERPATAPVHDVHALASIAADLEAETEKLLDEALIADFQETPLTTLEDVLEERREAGERLERWQIRAKELLDTELAKEKHEREVKDLEEAISVTQQPVPSTATGGKRDTKQRAAAAAAAPGAAGATDCSFSSSSTITGKADSIAAAATSAALPFKLHSAEQRSQDVNPYVLNLTEFVPETEATRVAKDLRAENEILKRCLSNTNKEPNAFESYLRRSAHTSL